METFSFKNLLPDFCQLPFDVVSNLSQCLNKEVNPSESISAVIIGILIFISVGFLIFSLLKFVQSRVHVGSYFKLLGNMNQSELVSRRKDITDSAAKKKDYFGRLWREFDESLVLHRTADGTYKLSNTLDAAHFFNTHSLARGLTENRLLAAVPGLLTAIGVIGTFAGLQMGLKGIDLSSDDVMELKKGIKHMIEGASIAFLTSLWGIGLSVAFNFFEKFLERSVRRQIGHLQNHIDFLYPRINAEQSLVEIADTSKIGTETMQGLAEKIGDKMQEAMSQVGETISTGLKDSLHEILSPALEKMATDAQTGSERALESMLDRFMDGFGQAGENQREMMNQSSEKVQQAVGQLGSQMTQFMGNLDERSKSVEEQNRLQREQMEAMLEGYESQSDERQKKMAGQFESLMDGITSGVKDQMDAQSQRDHERMQAFKVQVHQAAEHQKSNMTAFSEGVAKQLEQQQQLNQDRNDRSNEQMTAFSDGVANQLEHQRQLDQKRDDRSNEQMTAFSDGVANQLEHQRKLDQERNDRSNEQMSKMKLSQDELGNRLESLLAYQQQSHKKLYDELATLQEGFQQVTSANRTAAEQIKTSSDSMQSASMQLSVLGTKIKDAAESLGSSVEQAAQSAATVSEQNSAAITKLDEVLNQYQLFATEIRQTSETLRLATEHAESGFSSVDQHLQSFQKSMQKQVTDMEQHMQSLMSTFAEQVRAQLGERLHAWTDETSKFGQEMARAINAIHDAIDDLGKD